MMQKLMPNGLGSDCPQRQNGRRRLGVDWWAENSRGEIQIRMALCVTLQIKILTIIGQIRTWMMVITTRLLWAASRPMGTVCMIWRGMSGSGARTGMMKTTIQNQPSAARLGRVQEQFAFCGAGRGSILLTTSA